MNREAIIVGAGFGGATLALRLAQAGARPLILERGPWWERAPGAARDADPVAFPRGLSGALARGLRSIWWARSGPARQIMLRPRALFEWHAFSHLDVLTSSGVGGGSLVYTGIIERPSPDLFDAVPPEIGARDMDPWFERARAWLDPAPPPADAPRARRFDAAAAHLGLEGRAPDLAISWGDPSPGPGSLKPCVGCGQCVVGCRHGARGSLDLTLIPEALRLGATLRPMCEVEAIGRSADRWIVRYLDRRTGQRLQVQAPRLILAAGALGTVRLLMAARDRHRALPALPRTLGQRFFTNGDAAALMLSLTPDERGPSVTRIASDAAGFLAEFSAPLGALGLTAPALRRLVRISGIAAMGRDQGGSLTFDGRGLHTALSPASDGLHERQEARLRAMIAALSPGLAASTRTRLASVHPLGGAAMASTPERGVVDHRGEVFGHKGLFVADAAALPQAPGVPPVWTIAALAERQAALMIEAER